MTRVMDNVSDIEAAHFINKVKHRRRWTYPQKLRLAQEASAPGMTVTSVARKYGMAPSQLFRWRKFILKGSQEIISASDQGSDHGELQELKHRVGVLERLLGKATLENVILRENIALGNSRR